MGEPGRCVHVGDRESDIYELFCEARDLGTHFLVRTCVDCLAGDGEHTIAEEMAQVKVKGLHRVELRDSKGRPDEALLEIRYRRITVLPPLYKQRRYPELRLTVIHAHEPTMPAGRPPIEWKLITDLPVRSRADAAEKLDWYAMRWKIETFHKILKSGCKAEESKLRTADRLANLISVFCILRAYLLVDHAQPVRSRRACPASSHTNGNRPARSNRQRHAPHSASPTAHAQPHQARATRWLPCTH